MSKLIVSALTLALCALSAILDSATQLPVTTQDQLQTIQATASGTCTTIAQNANAKVLV